MIGKLKGKIIDFIDDDAVIDVNGVGYQVSGLSWVIVDQEVDVWIHTIVRENDISLVGFKSKQGCLLFKELLNVSGVGPKSALSLINEVGAEGIAAAIRDEEPLSLKAPGVGKKTAQRLIIDLKNKLDKIGIQAKATQASGSQLRIEDDRIQDTIEALLGLGYAQQQIDAALQDIIIADDYTSVDIIKLVLKKIS